MSTLRYICCRCDTRSDSALGHHVCVPPTNDDIDARIAEILGDGYIDSAGWHGLCQWSCVLDEGIRSLAPIALSRGYRWSLSSVGDGTEYRATFEAHLGNPAPSALDTTPARAFARGFLRIPKEEKC